MHRAGTRLSLWGSLPLAGPLASIFFFASLVGFAALRSDGYTHGTKAVSELGAIGAPMALAFNLLGFVLPGIGIVVLSLSILKMAPPKTSRAATSLLMLSGFAMIVSGVFPVDMSNRTSLTSSAHAIGAMSSGLFWALSLGWIGPVLRKHFGLTVLGNLTPWFWLFLIANIGWQVAWQTSGSVLPGWGQRIGFSGYFLWSFWAGTAIFRGRDALLHSR